MTFKYSLPTARADVLAGLTVAAISLPQAMAYALIAGIDPRFGLYSAIVVTFVASVFGSSNHLINGPTNAISLVVFSALAFIDPEARFDAYQATFLLAVMIGVIQILIAVFRLGDLTRYISESVIIGFMTGAGFLVALGQTANFLGIKDRGTGHQHVLVRFWNTITEGGPVNLYALGVGAGTIALVLVLRWIARRYRLPQMEMLLALVAAASVSAFLGWTIPGADNKTLIAVIGAVPGSLPAPHIPEIKFSWLQEMSSSALAISCLGLLEALAIAKSIAATTRQPLDYNRQCLAEGLANLAGGFFQCLPGSGSLTRSAINFQAGAVTRLSGVYAAIAVAIVVVLFAPLARYIPKAALAGLLLLTAYRLIDWDRIAYAVRASSYDAGLVAVTAFSAVFISVEFSILIGVALSILLFVPRAARPRGQELVVTPEGVIRERLPSDPECSALLIYDLEGELFFGAAPELEHRFEELKRRAADEGVRVLILRVKRTRNPDMVFLEHLERFLRDMEALGVAVLLCGVRPDFAKGLANLRFFDWLPRERVFLEEEREFSATLKAVRYGYKLIENNECTHCGENGVATAEARARYYLV
jgi:SulP family sulfate permease